MFFEGKSSQKHLGNIYKFFEKRNSFARVTTWQETSLWMGYDGFHDNVRKDLNYG